MNNLFFKNNGPFAIDKLLLLSKIESKNNIKKLGVTDIKDLATANNTEITFFHSKKYEYLAVKTKALFCITTNNLSKVLPNSCNAIIVDNVLIATAM
ncbi:UDP-3-O-(3-hydroxymyristoyl)glucosamine N-acyltransferase, partial [Candidatus Pelagibacter sp.]|nr:UDP-3-O-(3-hydroxymyristoyl)glucosamine N-acyltransferase [Candidatus Pelagibacter sp.]